MNIIELLLTNFTICFFVVQALFTRITGDLKGKTILPGNKTVVGMCLSRQVHLDKNSKPQLLHQEGSCCRVVQGKQERPSCHGP